MSLHEYFYEYIRVKNGFYPVSYVETGVCATWAMKQVIFYTFSDSGLILALFRPFKDEKIAEFVLLTR